MDEPMHLPAEIWIHIFEFATSVVPGVFSITDADAIATFVRGEYHASSATHTRQSMQVKLAINLVCTAWRELTYRFLFEYLSITNGDQALSIMSSLNSDIHAVSNTHRRTWWTVRLELALDGMRIWTAEHASALNQILQHCPNLVCFSSAFSTLDPYTLYSAALIDALTKPGTENKLKRIELKADTALFKTVSMALADSLEVIWYLSSRRPTADVDRRKCCLPKLHTFISDAYHGGIANYADLPALRALILRDTRSESILYILQNGQNLRYLNSKNLDSSISYMSLCPNLQTLVLNSIFDIAHIYLHHTLKTPHLNLQTLIIENNDALRLLFMGAGPNLAHRYLPNLLCNIHHTFPALKTIRLVFFPIPAMPPFPVNLFKAWKSWLNVCRLQGITIQIIQSEEQLLTHKWFPLTLKLVKDLL